MQEQESTPLLIQVSSPNGRIGLQSLPAQRQARVYESDLTFAASLHRDCVLLDHFSAWDGKSRFRHWTVSDRCNLFERLHAHLFQGRSSEWLASAYASCGEEGR